MVERHLAKVEVAGSNPVSRSKKRYAMKIKIAHLLLNPSHREDIPEDLWSSRMNKQSMSVGKWRSLSHGFHAYCEIYSNLNRTDLPSEGCAEPAIINPSREFNLTPPVLSYGHYGAYMAHRNAILNEFSEDVDALLVVEGDVSFSIPPDQMTEEIHRAAEFARANDGAMVTFGRISYGLASMAAESDTAVDMGEYKKIDHFLCAHCYLVLRSERDRIQEKLKTTGWHAWDIWLYWNYDRRVPIFAPHAPLVHEPDGASMIDYIPRSNE